MTNTDRQPPIISIIMPLHNSLLFMDDGIQSVLRQSFREFELLLVDDASHDGTLAYAHQLAEQDSRIRVIPRKQNGGGGAARNSGIAQARGRFLAFLDADDIWQDDKLKIQLKEMERLGAAFSYTDYSIVRMDGTKIKSRSVPSKVSYHDLLKDNVVGCSTAIYDVWSLGKRYFPLIRKRQDLALWLSILKSTDFAYKCGPELTRYRVRPGSVSANKLKAAMYTWRVYRHIEALGLLQSLYYFSHYAIASIARRL